MVETWFSTGFQPHVVPVPIAVSHPSQVVLQNRTHAQSLDLTVGVKVTDERH